MKYSIRLLHVKNHKKNDVSNIFKLGTYFALYSTVNISEFEQINAGWAFQTR